MKHKSSESGEKKSTEKECGRGRRVLKALYWFSGVLIALLFLLLLCRDFLIRRSVEVIGSHVSGVDITLEDVNTSLWKGSVSVSNLKIANPLGYDEPYLFKLEYLFIDVNLGTLFSKAFVINEIRISGLYAQGAIGENGKLNLALLNEHVQQKFPPPQETEKAKDEKSQAPSGKSLMLKRVIIENSSVSLREDHTDFLLRIPLDCEKEEIFIKNDGRSFAEMLNDFTNLVQAWCDGALHAGGALIDAGKSIINQGADAGKSFATPVADFFKKTFSGGKK